jgi:hypothetical protein
MITPKIAESIYRDHEHYWNRRRPEMRRLRNVYLMRYWERPDNYMEQLLIETSRGYELIESYIASLFVRDPSVIVKPDLRGRGDPNITEGTVNDWLLTTRREIEDGMRLALIYPFAAFKLVPCEVKDPLQRVQVACVAPWDTIVDASSTTWTKQRYVGHRYFLPLSEAKERYGKRKWAKRSFRRYLDREDPEQENVPARERQGDEDRVEGDFVMIVELYDMVKERMLVWSPDYANGERFVYDGIELEVGGAEDSESEKFDGIPYRTASDRPVVPIIPVYMSREPDDPLRGFSALRRVYDQIVEINTIRTFQAQGVRRAARQWLVVKGTMDEEAQSKICQGQDGEFIEVEITQGQTLAGSMMPVPHSPVPHELQLYENQVEDDFGRGSIMAPFTRGEATKATATEITALAAYSASEIGRMARERDAAIAQLASTYCVMLATLLGDDSEVIRLGNEVQVLTADDLTGEFRFYAQDSGSTPMSEAVRKQELLNLVGVLTELGANPQALLRDIVRTYDLSEDFLPDEQPDPNAAGAPSPPAPTPGVAPPTAGLPGMGLAPGQLPSPEQVGQVLPPGGVV